MQSGKTHKYSGRMLLQRRPITQGRTIILGVELKNKGEFDKAIEQFEKSLRGRQEPYLLFILISAMFNTGLNCEDAVAYSRKALTLKLNQQSYPLDVLNKLGRTYSAMGQVENAIDAFKEAPKVYPTAVLLLIITLEFNILRPADLTLQLKRWRRR